MKQQTVPFLCILVFPELICLSVFCVMVPPCIIILVLWAIIRWNKGYWDTSIGCWSSQLVSKRAISQIKSSMLGIGMRWKWLLRVGQQNSMSFCLYTQRCAIKTYETECSSVVERTLRMYKGPGFILSVPKIITKPRNCWLHEIFQLILSGHLVVGGWLEL